VIDNEGKFRDESGKLLSTFDSDSANPKSGEGMLVSGATATATNLSSKWTNPST
jgi:hypothetical protein